MFSARDSELKALTVAFTATRPLTGASFPVLKPVKFLGESLRVSLGDLSPGRGNLSLSLYCVEAVGTAASGTTDAALRETLAVQFEAFGTRAVALTLARQCCLLILFSL